MAQQTDHIGDTNKMVTAVEWLFKHIEGVRIIDGYEFIKLQEAFEQAKQMEKEQRNKDYNAGYMDSQCNHVNDCENYGNEQDYAR